MRRLQKKKEEEEEPYFSLLEPTIGRVCRPRLALARHLQRARCLNVASNDPMLKKKKKKQRESRRAQEAPIPPFTSTGDFQARHDVEKKPPPRRRPASAPSSRRKSDERRTLQASPRLLEYRPGTAVYCRRGELDKRAVRDLEKVAVSRNDERHRLKWSLLFNLFRAFEVHFQPRLELFRRLEEKKRGVEARVARRLLDWIDKLFRLEAKPFARGPSASRLQTSSRCLLSASSRTNRDRVLSREGFLSLLEKNGLNFPKSMARSLWEVVASKDVVPLKLFLMAFALFLALGRSEAPLQTAITVYDASQQSTITDIFTLPAKDSDDRRHIRGLLNAELLPTLLDPAVDDDDDDDRRRTIKKNLENALTTCPRLLADFQRHIRAVTTMTLSAPVPIGDTRLLLLKRRRQQRLFITS